jgi:hypothetical protein
MSSEQSITSISFNKRRYHEIDIMLDWCRERIGTGGYMDSPEHLWTVTSIYGYTTFYFRRAQDATLFQLRWA